MGLNEKLDKIKEMDKTTLGNAVNQAQKILGATVSERAKERLKDPAELQRIINSLTKEDIAAIENALKNPGSLGSIAKDKKAADRIHEVVED
ncbi:MAG: hypothetical protein Q8865_07240 [Bacillota bacterium]|nr:hypothetical protein [Bacillota bacterium]